jgi:hypothetical protein
MKGYRILLLNLASAIMMVLIGFDWVSLGLSAQTVALITAGINVANMILRAFTNTPITKSS